MMKKLLVNQQNLTKRLRHLSLFLASLLLPLGTWAETINLDGDLGNPNSTSTYWSVGNSYYYWYTNKSFLSTVTLRTGDSIIMTCGEPFKGELNLFSLTPDYTAEEWAEANYTLTLYIASEQSSTPASKRQVAELTYNNGTLTYVPSVGATAGAPTLNGEYLQVELLNNGDEKTFFNKKIFTHATVTIEGDDGVFLGETKLTDNTAMPEGVSYDENSHTLTLDNATLEDNILTFGTNLIISLVGENTINGCLNGYKCNGKNAGALTLANAAGEACSLHISSGDSNTSVATGFSSFSYTGFEGTIANSDKYVQWSSNQLMYYDNGLKPITDVTFTSDYGLEVGYEAVTAENVNDILGDDGSVSYNPSTKTLTLHDASFEGDIVWSNTTDLHITIIGDNTVQGEISGIGTGILHVVRDETGADCSLTVDNSYSLCINGFSDVVAEGLNISTTQMGGILVEEGSEPTNSIFNSKKVVFTTANLFDIWLGEEQVTSKNKNNILGETNNDGSATATYDPETNVLTLNNANFGYGGELSVPSFTIGIDLTIRLIGQSQFMGEKLIVTEGHTATFTTDENEPGSLSLWTVEGNLVYENGLSYYMTEEENYIIGVDDSERYDLWVAGKQVTANTASNILGDYSVSWDDDTKTLSLYEATIQGGIVSSMATGFNIHLSGVNTITTDDVAINSTPSGWQPITITADDGAMLLTNVTSEENFFSDYNHGRMDVPTLPEDYALSYDMEGIFSIAQRYDVYLQSMVNDNLGQQYITEANYNRLLGTEDVATVTYDPSESILTLNNMDETGAAPYGTTFFVVGDGYDATLTINLKGENILRNWSDVGDVSFASCSNIIFTTDADNPGSLTITDIDTSYDYGEDFMFNGNVTYQNGLAYSKDDKGNHYVRVQESDKYNLAIGDVTITKANASAIHEADQEFISVADGGSVTFDAESSTLTLNNATLKHGIISGLENLTIRFIGTNKVNTDSQVSWMSTQEAAQNNAISTEVETASLTFEKEGNSSIELYGKTTADYSIISGFASISYGNGDNQCYLHSSVPAKYDATDKKMVNFYEGNNITKATVSSIVSYPLWIGDYDPFIQVTGENHSGITGRAIETGTVSFDAANNTLSLNKATIDGKVLSALGRLTIDVEGNCCIVTSDSGSVVHSVNAGMLTIKKTGEQASLKVENYTTDYDFHYPVIQGFSNLDYTGFNLDTKTSAVYQTYEHPWIGGTSIGLINPDIDPEDEESGIWIGITSATFTTAELYPLWVAGTRVTSFNKDNVRNDETKTVRFDVDNNTLTLKNAMINLDGEGIPFECSLDNLTVFLIGSSQIEGNYDYPLLLNNSQAEISNLTFDTNAGQPGKLSFTAATLQAGFSTAYKHGLSCNQVEEMTYLIAVSSVSSGITVCGTEVTNINADDVLNDGGSVTYDDATATLTLRDVLWEDQQIIVTEESSISTLTVMLTGQNAIDNTISGQPVFVSEKTDVLLAFTTDVNSPGTLTMVGKDNASFQNGFVFTTEREDETHLKNGLLQGSTDGGWKIATFIPIEPIVDEEEPEIVVAITNDETKYSNLDGQTIDNVLYSLPETGDGEQAPLQGFDNSIIDNEPGIVIGTPTSDEVAEAAANTVVGSSEFQETEFVGVTLMAPAGVGEISFTAKSINGGVLKVKVGDEEPYVPEGLNAQEYTTISIPYYSDEPTIIFLYLSELSLSRQESPYKGKVKSTSVKISNYGGRSQAIYSNGTASVYSLPDGAHNKTNNTVSMSSVNASSYSSAAYSRQARVYRKQESATSYPIVSLAPSVFNEIADKGSIRYIDLSGSQLKDFTVNREMGVLNGFGEQTLILLPEDNDNGGEANVVIGDDCQQLSLDDHYTFMAPEKTFTAQNVTLNRTFTVGQSTTLFLPFTIPADQAQEMGQFHAFMNLNDEEASFYDASTDDIPANTPFIFVPQDTNLKAENVNVQGLNSTFAASENFVGTYQTILWDEAQTLNYVFIPDNESDETLSGQFIQAPAGTSVLPFCATLQVSDATSATLKVVIGNQTTSVTDVVQVPVQGQWFTLDGRKLQGQPVSKGLYINKGGKKVIK